MRILRKRFILLPIAAALIASLNLTPAFALDSANGGYPPGSGGKDSYGSRGHKSGSGGYSHDSGGYSSGSGDEYMYDSGGYSYDSGDEYMYNSGGYSYDSGDEYMYNSGGYSYDSGDEYMYNPGGYSYDPGDEYMYNSGGYSYDSGGYSHGSGGYSYGSGGGYSHGSPGYSGRYDGGYSYGKEKNPYPAPLYKAPSAGYPGYPEYHTPNRVYAVYVVQRGDTLASIARRFRTSVAALLAANPAISNPDLIYPGQKLIIPLSKTGSTGAYGYGYGSPAPPPGYQPSKPMMPPKGMPGGRPPPGYPPSEPPMPPKGMPGAPPPPQPPPGMPPPGMPPPAQQTVTIDLAAANVAFSTSTIQVPAGARVVVNFDNQDAGIPHNFAVYTDSSAQQAIFRGSVITGPARMTYTFTAPSQPGTYFFRCDVHPMMMTGTFVVN